MSCEWNRVCIPRGFNESLALIRIIHTSRETWRAFEDVVTLIQGQTERYIRTRALRNYYFADTFINWNDLRIVGFCLVAHVSAQTRKLQKLWHWDFRWRETPRQGRGEEGLFCARGWCSKGWLATEQKFKGGDTRVSRYIDRTWNIHLSRSAHLPFLFYVSPSGLFLSLSLSPRSLSLSSRSSSALDASTGILF